MRHGARTWHNNDFSGSQRCPSHDMRMISPLLPQGDVLRRAGRDVFCIAPMLLLLFCSSPCAGLVPLAPFGTIVGDAMLTAGTDDKYFGPFNLSLPLVFPDGGRETAYYVSSNGLLCFTNTSSFSLQPVYTKSIGRMIAAAFGDLKTPSSGAAGGMYHRTISGNASAIRSLWSDVLPSIPFIPTHALVYTLDRCPRYGATSNLTTAQTIILWSSQRVMMLFRVQLVQPSTLVFGGYVGPVGTTHVYRGNSSLWPTMSNVGVPGVHVVLITTATTSASMDLTTSRSLSVDASSSSSFRTASHDPFSMSGTREASATSTPSSPQQSQTNSQSVLRSTSTISSTTTASALTSSATCAQQFSLRVGSNGTSASVDVVGSVPMLEGCSVAPAPKEINVSSPTTAAPTSCVTDMFPLAVDSNISSAMPNRSTNAFVSTSPIVISLASSHLPLFAIPKARVTVVVPLIIPRQWTLRSDDTENVVVQAGNDANDGAYTAIVVWQLRDPGAVQYSTSTNVTLEARCIAGGGEATVVVVEVRWPDPPPALRTVSAATVGVVATTAALGLVAGAGDVSSSVSVVMLALLACSDTPPPISAATYFISVFFPYGMLAMALGNVGIAAAVCVVHGAFVWSVVRCTPRVSLSADRVDRGNVATTDVVGLHLAAMGRCRYPSWSLRLVTMLLPGSVLGAVVLGARHGSPPGDVAACVAALLCVLGILGAQCVLLHRMVLPRASFVPYGWYCVGLAVERRFLFPTSRWEPVELHQAFNPLFTGMRPGYCPLSMMEPTLSCVVAAVSGAFLSGTCEPLLLAIAAALHVAYGVFLAAVRPHRLPMDRVCAPLVYLLLGCICAIRYARPNDSAADTLQTVLSELQLWRSLWSLFVTMLREPALRIGDRYRESHARELSMTLHDVDSTTNAALELSFLQEHNDDDDDGTAIAERMNDAVDQSNFWDLDGNAMALASHVDVNDGDMSLWAFSSTTESDVRGQGLCSPPPTLFSTYFSESTAK